MVAPAGKPLSNVLKDANGQSTLKLSPEVEAAKVGLIYQTEQLAANRIQSGTSTGKS